MTIELTPHSTLPERIRHSAQSVERALIACIKEIDERTDTVFVADVAYPPTSVSDPLKACIQHYSRLERDAGMLPAQILIQVKHILYAVSPGHHNEFLRPMLVGWVIAAYYQAEV